MTKYNSIHKDLDRVYMSLRSEDIIESNIESGRIIIFSDQHRGVRDGADDFKRCEDAYRTALKYYFENDYTLIILGDAEDLWECRHGPVLRKYEGTLKLEAKFYLNNENRYYRIYGNHDDYWEEVGYISIDGTQITVKEKMVIRLKDNNQNRIGEIFLVHGHQGYRFKRLSKFVVRYIWRPFQRLTNIKSTTPAKDSTLRGELNLILYNWAFNKNKEEKKLLLIAGHTHQPVFASRDHIGKIVDELKIIEERYNDAIESGNPNASNIEIQLTNMKYQLDHRRERENLESNQNGISMDKPCYFNTGCCSYSDGDITGIEISNSSIKLVKWSRNKSQLEVLENAEIDSAIFNRL
jgi:metallophosphoesterase superfamily enzyme